MSNIGQLGVGIVILLINISYLAYIVHTTLKYAREDILIITPSCLTKCVVRCLFTKEQGDKILDSKKEVKVDSSW